MCRKQNYCEVLPQTRIDKPEIHQRRPWCTLEMGTPAGSNILALTTARNFIPSSYLHFLFDGPCWKLRPVHMPSAFPQVCVNPLSLSSASWHTAVRSPGPKPAAAHLRSHKLEELASLSFGLTNLWQMYPVTHPLDNSTLMTVGL